MQSNISDYPAEMPTRLIVPGALTLDRVRWIPAGARVTGTVGDDSFDIALEVGDLLDRRRFCFALWRFKKLLAVQPTIEAWQEAIAQAEGSEA